MAHTERCSSAHRARCQCPCSGGLHGYVNGKFCSEQRVRINSPVRSAIESSPQWAGLAAAPRTVVDRALARARRRARDEIKRATRQISRTLADGLIKRAPVESIVDAAVESLMKAEGASGKDARSLAAKGLELHILCTLFVVCHRVIDDVGEAASWTVERFIDAAIDLPDKPRTIRNAVVAGVKEAFAERLSDKAIDVFFAGTGFPDREQLRILAIMFCPNFERHPAVQELASMVAVDFASDAVSRSITESFSVAGAPA